MTASTDFSWVGSLSPTRYYDPTAILVRSQYDVVGGVLLVAIAVGLVGLARVVFRRVDIH